MRLLVTMKTLRIEKKSREYSTNGRVALDFLRERNLAGQWITAEILRTSGIPFDVIDPALLKLAGEFNADMRVGRVSGELEFRFDDLSTARWIYRLPAAMQPLVDGLWRQRRALKTPLVGVCVTTVLGLVVLGYLGLFVSVMPETMSGGQFAVSIVLLAMALVLLMVVGVLVALPVAFLLGLVTGEFQAFLGLLFPAGLIGVALFVLRRSFVRLQTRLVGLFSSILNFGRAPQRELEMEREFLALAAARGGRLSIGDLMILYGWPYDRSFQELTYLMLDYGGDVEVDDAGRMSFIFHELADAPTDCGMPAPIWERSRSPGEIFDSKARRADWIGFVVWNLLLTVPILGMLNLREEGLSPEVLGFVAVLVLPVPLYGVIRRRVVAGRQQRYEARRRFLEQLQHAVGAGGVVPLEEEAFDETFVAAVGGDIDPEQGMYVFPEFREPLVARGLEESGQVVGA